MTFIPGRVYRRGYIHERYGGQRQGGISTPADQPMIFLFTGEQGEQYGYRDGFQPDGTFWYTGEGQVGDMVMVRGNLAIRDHHGAGKTLHLFEYVKMGQVRYAGGATYLGHHTEPAPDRNGNPRRAIVFHLALETTPDGSSAQRVAVPPRREKSSLWRQPVRRLRELALRKFPPGATLKQRLANTYARSEAVRVYVLRRAEGTCEGCGRPAPFKTSNGRPYLEPHHIRRRADGGPDHPRWVVAICPNCHRRVHHGGDGDDYNEHLAKLVGAKERALNS